MNAEQGCGSSCCVRSSAGAKATSNTHFAQSAHDTSIGRGEVKRGLLIEKMALILGHYGRNRYILKSTRAA
jgi:hypothetical protein